MLLDQHFHCPSDVNVLEIKKNLGRIEGALPALPVTCLKSADPDCKDSKGHTPQDAAHLHACPGWFAADTTDVFRVLSFIFAAAHVAGANKRCRRQETCYDDYTQTAPVMMANPYSYAWFAVEAAGLSPPVAGIIPCRPLELGTRVVVPPDAKKDPTRIRPLIGTNPIPRGAEIISLYVDTSGKYFIYHDDIEGAKAYLPGEMKRYYFPDGKRPQ
jgi:hypothetical protein